jgi:pyridinium-3,5-bisthiocarboxylic acid mononucleotide nickel chelatase
MHIHLDLVGGLSGDMFIGVMLDCFPDQAANLQAVMVDAGFADLVKLDTEAADDGTLTGTHFTVTADRDAEGHHHRHYSEIKRILGDSNLDEGTRDAAIGIFEIIAIAEASIHGKEVEAVAFHEVGAWDSIADVVCAAFLITHCGVSSWSVSRLPIGRGQVKTAHGMLPIPAPATSLILKGFEFFDDEIEGERITPTGAAILKYLQPARGIPSTGVELSGTGIGFGTKRFPGLSNVTRALMFSSSATGLWETDQVLQLEFEIDDQTAEAVAVALDRLRSTPGVIDVIQMAYFGKKGRQGVSVRLLAMPSTQNDVVESCFRETTTLGIRTQLVTRAKLSRVESVIEYEGSQYRVKASRRPGGTTAKVEMDDLQTVSITRRETIRQAVERLALDQQ